jgi:Tau95 Triple barrel domain
MDSNDDDAPVYEFPDTKIVALEHPCIIRNLNRGIKSLGGNQRLQEVALSSHQSHLNMVVSASSSDKTKDPLCISETRRPVCIKGCGPEGQDQQLSSQSDGPKTNRSEA